MICYKCGKEDNFIVNGCCFECHEKSTRILSPKEIKIKKGEENDSNSK